MGASGEPYMLELQNIRRMRGGETLWPEVGKLPPYNALAPALSVRPKTIGSH